MKDDPLSLSIIFSFRNEEEVLPELLNRLKKVLIPLNVAYELIFVNDSSTDRSLPILMEQAKQDKHIKIINMSRRFGGEECFLAGMQYSKGSCVITMDADLQDPPELIPELVDHWLKGADIVHTTRISRVGESFLKIGLTKLGYRILRFFTNIDLPVDSGMFKLLSRRVVEELLKSGEKDPFLKGLIAWVGFKKTQIFYHRQKRFAGKSHFPIFSNPDVVRLFLVGIASFSTLPLLVSFFFGLVVSLGALIHLLLMDSSQKSWMMTIIIFLGGIQLMTMGIFGFYLGRICNQVGNRPRYIIESMIGFEDLN